MDATHCINPWVITQRLQSPSSSMGKAGDTIFVLPGHPFLSKIQKNHPGKGSHLWIHDQCTAVPAPVQGSGHHVGNLLHPVLLDKLNRCSNDLGLIFQWERTALVNSSTAQIKTLVIMK